MDKQYKGRSAAEVIRDRIAEGTYNVVVGKPDGRETRIRSVTKRECNLLTN